MEGSYNGAHPSRGVRLLESRALAGGVQTPCDGACWAFLPQPLFTEVLRHLQLLRLPGRDGAAGVSGGAATAATAADVCSSMRVCRDWLRLCREGLAALRPASLPSQPPVRLHRQQDRQDRLCLSPKLLSGGKALGALLHPQQQEHHRLVVGVRPNGWLTFPHLTELDLSAIRLVVHIAAELRHQRDDLAGIGQLQELRRLTLPLGLLAAAPPGRPPAASVLHPPGKTQQSTAAVDAASSSSSGNNSGGTTAVALETTTRGPQLSWPAWLQHLPHLRDLVVITYCRTATLYGEPHKRPPDDALLGLLYDGIHVADLPQLPSLVALELQLPGSAVTGGGLLWSLPSLRSLELRSTDSGALTGMQLAAMLFGAPGRCLAHLHLPCLSSSPRQSLGLQLAEANGGAAAAATIVKPLEGLRALAAAAGFALAAVSDPTHRPQTPDSAAPNFLDPGSPLLPPPPPAPWGLRTSLRSLSLSGRCVLADLLAAAAHLSAVTSLSLAGCDVRPRGFAEGLLTRHPVTGHAAAAGGGGAGVGGQPGGLWEILYGSSAAVPRAAWRLLRLDLTACRWLTAVPLFAANISRLLLSLSRPGDLHFLSLSSTGITRLPDALLQPPVQPKLGTERADSGPSAHGYAYEPPASGMGGTSCIGGLGAALTELDLSGNCLQAIPESFAAACPRLRTLRVDDNGTLPAAHTSSQQPPAYHAHTHDLRALLPGGATAAAAATLQLAAAGPGGGGAGRGARVPALPPGLRDLSLSAHGSPGGAPLCPSAASLAEHPATQLRRLHVSHCSMPALTSMLPYLPVLAELVAIHVPTSVRGAAVHTPAAVASAAAADCDCDGGASVSAQHRYRQATISDALAGCAVSGSITSKPRSWRDRNDCPRSDGGPGGLQAPSTLNAEGDAETIARCLTKVTIRGDVWDELLTACRNGGSGSAGNAATNGGGDGRRGGSSSSGGGGGGGGRGRRDASLYWLERLCAYAPGIRKLSYTRMGLTAVPDGIAAVEDLISLNLSHNRITSVSESVGCLSRLESLLLRSNQLAAMPGQLVRLTRLASLDVYGNPSLPPHQVAALQAALPGLVRLRADEGPPDWSPASRAQKARDGDVEAEAAAVVAPVAEPRCGPAAADLGGGGGGSSDHAGDRGRRGHGPGGLLRTAEGRYKPLLCGA